jgi:2-polyprenyl-3-methyl-5-hydroxy-6-metoxy-1,4-benzoquinol methylase
LQWPFPGAPGILPLQVSRVLQRRQKCGLRKLSVSVSVGQKQNQGIVFFPFGSKRTPLPDSFGTLPVRNSIFSVRLHKRLGKLALLMPQGLQERRLNSALASEGISAEPIYQTVLHLCRTLQLTGDLLEFGAGTGTLATQLSVSHNGGTITCADIRPRPELLPASILWLQTDLNNVIPVPDNSFNIVVSTEVIEHLENPRAIFREFYRLLRPKGVLIVTTPNQESVRSLSGLLMGGHFVAFLGKSYPAHITALLRKDFQRICRETSFNPPKFYYTDSGGIPKLPQIQWQSLTFGLLKGRLFSDNIAIVTRKP